LRIETLFLDVDETDSVLPDVYLHYDSIKSQGIYRPSVRGAPTETPESLYNAGYGPNRECGERLTQRFADGTTILYTFHSVVDKLDEEDADFSDYDPEEMSWLRIHEIKLPISRLKLGESVSF
jgi:hypothetical protein